jgi:hypothetical protein
MPESVVPTGVVVGMLGEGVPNVTVGVGAPAAVTLMVMLLVVVLNPCLADTVQM